MKCILIAGIIAGTALAACNDFKDENHMQKMAAMKDSIFKAHPSVASITLNVQDNKLFIITLGSKKLAKSTDAERQMLAGDLGAMTLRLFGKDNGISKEKLIITPNEMNDQAEPTDGVITALDMDSLQKATVR